MVLRHTQKLLCSFSGPKIGKISFGNFCLQPTALLSGSCSLWLQLQKFALRIFPIPLEFFGLAKFFLLANSIEILYEWNLCGVNEVNPTYFRQPFVKRLCINLSEGWLQEISFSMLFNNKNSCCNYGSPQTIFIAFG